VSKYFCISKFGMRNQCFRGMSEEGGFEACERMIRQDVFTGLTAVLREVSTFTTSINTSL